MTAATGAATQPYVREAGEGAIWFVNNRATIKASAAETGGTFALLEMLVAPGHAPPLHIHHAEAESFWILEGQFTVQVGERTFRAGPGTFIYTPRGIPHTFRLEGDTPGRLGVLLIPGGGEGFFVELGRPAEGEGLPTPAPPDIARMQAVAAKYQVEFVGPPLAPDATP